jgi:hypothetical protein
VQSATKSFAIITTSSPIIGIRKEWAEAGETIIRAISKPHIGGVTKRKDQSEWISHRKQVGGPLTLLQSLLLIVSEFLPEIFREERARPRPIWPCFLGLKCSPFDGADRVRSSRVLSRRALHTDSLQKSSGKATPAPSRPLCLRRIPCLESVPDLIGRPHRVATIYLATTNSQLHKI